MKIFRLVAIAAASFPHCGASLSATAADTYPNRPVQRDIGARLQHLIYVRPASG